MPKTGAIVLAPFHYEVERKLSNLMAHLPRAGSSRDRGPLSERGSADLLQKRTHQAQWIGSNCARNVDELEHIETPLPALIFGNK